MCVKQQKAKADPAHPTSTLKERTQILKFWHFRVQAGQGSTPPSTVIETQSPNLAFPT